MAILLIVAWAVLAGLGWVLVHSVPSFHAAISQAAVTHPFLLYSGVGFALAAIAAVVLAVGAIVAVVVYRARHPAEKS
ncbi:MAG TPA: hypothetical protein VF265_02070 [Nevskiaceae bacterium]